MRSLIIFFIIFTFSFTPRANANVVMVFDPIESSLLNTYPAEKEAEEQVYYIPQETKVSGKKSSSKKWFWGLLIAAVIGGVAAAAGGGGGGSDNGSGNTGGGGGGSDNGSGNTGGGTTGDGTIMW